MARIISSAAKCRCIRLWVQQKQQQRGRCLENELSPTDAGSIRIISPLSGRAIRDERLCGWMYVHICLSVTLCLSSHLIMSVWLLINIDVHVCICLIVYVAPSLSSVKALHYEGATLLLSKISYKVQYFYVCHQMSALLCLHASILVHGCLYMWPFVKTMKALSKDSYKVQYFYVCVSPS